VTGLTQLLFLVVVECVKSATMDLLQQNVDTLLDLSVTLFLSLLGQTRFVPRVAPMLAGTVLGLNRRVIFDHIIK
tara:strand:+ start:996 stop:1220 length:225 start_codon:yes stop_codon:yes gene_type:complete